MFLKIILTYSKNRLKPNTCQIIVGSHYLRQKSLQISEGSLNNFHEINSHVVPKMGEVAQALHLSNTFQDDLILLANMGDDLLTSL